MTLNLMTGANLAVVSASVDGVQRRGAETVGAKVVSVSETVEGVTVVFAPAARNRRMISGFAAYVRPSLAIGP